MKLLLKVMSVMLFVGSALCRVPQIADADFFLSHAQPTEVKRDYTTPISLRRVDLQRIRDRKDKIGALLDGQASTRKTTRIGVGVSALLAFFCSGMYWYLSPSQATVPQVAQDPVDPAHISARDRFYEEGIRLQMENRTITGACKNGFYTGFGYAFASLPVMIVLSVMGKITGESILPALKEMFYPTTSDVVCKQDKQFKHSFDYVGRALWRIRDELARVRSEKQLQEFRRWRSVMTADLESGLGAAVLAVENFCALAVEFSMRAAQEMDEENIPVDLFQEIAGKVDGLVSAMNELLENAENAMNCEIAEDLDLRLTCLSMSFQTTLRAAQSAQDLIAQSVEVLS